MAPTAPEDPRSDEELVDACNAGDPRAFDALYERHKGWAVGVAYRFTRDRDGALDVMQDAFVYLLSRFPGFRLSGRLRSYLYVLLKHGAYTRARRARERGDAIDQHDAGSARARDGVVEGEASGRLVRAVESLPDGQREVLLMRIVDGMSMEEIAGALSVPVGTVKSRLHHALAALRANPATAGYFGEMSGPG